MPNAKQRERATNDALEARDLPPVKGRGVPDPSIWFGLDDAGHRNGRNVRDLAKAIRARDFAEAELCLDLMARDNPVFRDQVALGRQSA